VGRPVARPGRAVVAEDRQGQAVALKGLLQLRLHRQALLIGAGLQQEVVAAVIVAGGQGIAALAVVDEEVALEVHLPQLIGCASLEALARAAADAVHKPLQLALTTEDGGDGAGRGHMLSALITQHLGDLTRAPVGGRSAPFHHFNAIQNAYRDLFNPIDTRQARECN